MSQQGAGVKKERREIQASFAISLHRVTAASSPRIPVLRSASRSNRTAHRSRAIGLIVLS
jgi:hypothetical protein